MLAAAIEAAAAVIVTDNLKHFPSALLKPHSFEARSTDDIIADVIDRHSIETISAIKEMRERLNRPDLDVGAFIHKAEVQELTQSAAAMNKCRTSP